MGLVSATATTTTTAVSPPRQRHGDWYGRFFYCCIGHTIPSITTAQGHDNHHNTKTTTTTHKSSFLVHQDSSLDGHCECGDSSTDGPGAACLSAGPDGGAEEEVVHAAAAAAANSRPA
jgi:hypothetical protein